MPWTFPSPGGLNKMIECLVKYFPEHLKTQEMCDEAVDIEPLSLAYVPDRFKTKEMCNKAVRSEPRSSEFIPDIFKTQEMCNEAVRRKPYALAYVPDHFKTQETCKKPLKKTHSSCMVFLIILRHKKCVKGLLKIIHTT